MYRGKKIPVMSSWRVCHKKWRYYIHTTLHMFPLGSDFFYNRKIVWVLCNYCDVNGVLFWQVVVKPKVTKVQAKKKIVLKI